MKIQLSNIYGKMEKFLANALNDEFEIGNEGIYLDFSTPDKAYEGIKNALLKGQKVISGTTNIDNDKMIELKKLSILNEASFIWVPNYAIGASVMGELLDIIKGKFRDISISETHHISKIDTPSGTAKEYGNKLNVTNIVSNRLDTNIIYHEISLENPGEKLIIRHEILDKEAFLNGIRLAINVISNIDYILLIGLDDFYDLLKSNN